MSQTLEYCPNCGEKRQDGASYCHRCGYSFLAAPTSAKWVGSNRRSTRRSSADQAIWGVLSFVAFLAALLLTFIQYPDLIERILIYFREMVALQRLVLPPEILGRPIIYFLNLSGIIGIILGALRLGLSRFPRDGLSNIIGGFLAIYLAQIMGQFYDGLISGQVLVMDAIVAFIVVIILNIVVWALARPLSYPVYSRHFHS